MNELVKVYSTSDDIETQLILSLLSDNDITCLKKDDGSGEYMRMYMGTPMFGKDIFVNEKEYSRAKQLIEDLKSANNSDVEELNYDENDNEKEETYYKSKIRIKRIIAIIMFMIMFGFPFLLVMFFYIFGMIY